MKAMLLGMNSPKNNRCLEYDSPGAGLNLFKYSKLQREAYEAAFDRMNLIQNREWDEEMGRESGKKLLRRFVAEGRKVVVLGYKVWSCLLLPDTKPLSVYRSGEATFYMVPHTSGRNRWYNEKANQKKVGRLLQMLAAEALEAEGWLRAS